MESTHLEVCVVDDVLDAGHDHGEVVAEVLGAGDTTNPSPVDVIAVCGHSADHDDTLEHQRRDEDEGEVLDDVHDGEVGPGVAGPDVAELALRGQLAHVTKDEVHLGELRDALMVVLQV